MTTCKDCLHFKICWECANILDPLHGGVPCEDFLSTADVVPKSEYDNLKFQFEALDHECDRLEMVESRRHDAIVEAKSEVAREILAEIEEERERWKAIYSSNHFRDGGDAYGYLEDDVDHTIYELKKKYTERSDTK